MHGSDRTNKVALVKTDQGRQFVVDLGPTPALQNIKLQQGVQLQVQGRPARIGDQLVLLAQQVTANGQTVQINRPQQPMAPQQQSKSTPQARGRWEHPQASMINVASASDLIGRRVHDTRSRHTGTVEYLMIDAQNGDVLYALIGSGGALDISDNLIAVPWQAVELKRRALTVNKTLDELKTAPHFSPDRLTELTQPAVVSLIHNHYLVPEGREQPGAKQQQAPQGQQERQARQGSQPRLLIGREMITTLVEPILTTAQGMQGRQVTGMNGQMVGEIDQVLIDPDHGHVAYVLLAQAQFLGMGGQWLPVPFEALEWSMSNQNYLLTVSVDKLRRMPLLPRQTLPTRVPTANLQQLYAHYNVTPYWERSAQAAERPGQRRQRASITATVQELDKQQGIVTLQTASGKTVDLQVSQELLGSLQAGDRVEVTIRQSPESQQRSGMQRMSPSQSGQQR